MQMFVNLLVFLELQCVELSHYRNYQQNVVKDSKVKVLKHQKCPLQCYITIQYIILLEYYR